MPLRAQRAEMLGHLGVGVPRGTDKVIAELTKPADDDDEVVAKAPDACCLKGNIHDGEPKGTKIAIAGVDTYVSEPPKGLANGNILLYFPDVFGLFTNSFLLMDAFADAGYLTFGLDYFRGDPVWLHRKHKGDTTTEPGFDFDAWRAKHVAFSNEITPIWAKEVKEKYGKIGTKYTCVGYCYGAPYVCDQLAESGLCTAGAVAHPTSLKESHFYNLTKPLFLSCAEIDDKFPNDSRNRAVGIMQVEKKQFQVQLFQGVEHGFAVRCDINNPYQRYTKEQSLKGIVDWFDFWLSQ